MFDRETNCRTHCWLLCWLNFFLHEDDQDPTCVRSRTGYIITIGDCPVLWSSKLQIETALSIMEAEYIALRTSLKQLIPFKRLVESV